ncbi:lactate utilization protein [Helicovermis profundi]|uniref:Lactate utilization protein n=1 Tax=Helicovermis profundi TaxID=3065157 RepID=A0AAU9E670_9FIRM|nr:lactate utilization protein [Clostridia bacterium S502]
MSKNIEWLNSKKIEKTIDNFRKNNMDAFFVRDETELINKIDSFIKDNMKVSLGGSMTLFETGVIDYLRHKNINFLDRYKEGLTGEDIKKIYFESFDTDVYFSSSNAITENGELYNVDGNGNRVAAMIYGPKKVIVVVGINKLVKNLDDAIKRNKEISAPANAKRLSRNTPCAKTGYCVDCSSKDRICNDYVVIKKQANKDRIKVIIVNKTLGY